MMISQIVSERNGWRLLSKSRCERKGLQSSKGATTPTSHVIHKNLTKISSDEDNYVSADRGHT